LKGASEGLQGLQGVSKGLKGGFKVKGASRRLVGASEGLQGGFRKV